MKRKNLASFLFLLALGAGPLAWAQQQADGSARAGISLGGAVSTDDRISTQANPQLTFEAYRLELTADARPTEAARFHAETWVRSAGLLPSSLGSTASLFSTGGAAPVSLDLREAWFELKGFLFDSVDLKVGRQRISWGTADTLNVTDNVNPLDLGDPWDFGRHLGSDGVQLNVYAGGIQVTALAVAQFAPAVLPTGQWAAALMPSSLQAPPGMTIGSVSTTVSLPGAAIADSITAGLKVKGNLLGVDLSASYLYGRLGLPVVDRIVITTPGLPVVDVATNLVYPREHIFGADLAASIFGIGLWAEAAVFLPTEVTLTTDTTGIGGGVAASTALAATPYVKYVVGADYTFPGNVYLNGQFIHGLFQEAGDGNLHDYLSVGLQWRLFEEKVTLSPLGVIFEVGNWRDIPGSYAVMAAPSVSFRPLDNAELVVGVHWIQAAASSAFGGLSGQNEVFAHARYSF
jgi:hypothetical protein